MYIVRHIENQVKVMGFDQNRGENELLFVALKLKYFKIKKLFKD